MSASQLKALHNLVQKENAVFIGFDKATLTLLAFVLLFALRLENKKVNVI